LAISFSPTAVIHGPPNDMPSSTSETEATTQEVRVSIECGRSRVSTDRAPAGGGSLAGTVKPNPGGLA
jgi:hypothetical protein